MVGGARLLFDCCQAFVAETAFCFWRSAIGTDITACLSQLFSPGFTDGAGFRFGWILSAVVTEATPFVCDDVVKTENLDWIFLLDVSLLLRLARGRIVTVEYVG